MDKVTNPSSPEFFGSPLRLASARLHPDLPFHVTHMVLPSKELPQHSVQYALSAYFDTSPIAWIQKRWDPTMPKYNIWLSICQSLTSRLLGMLHFPFSLFLSLFFRPSFFCSFFLSFFLSFFHSFYLTIIILKVQEGKEDGSWKILTLILCDRVPIHSRVSWGGHSSQAPGKN